MPRSAALVIAALVVVAGCGGRSGSTPEPGAAGTASDHSGVLAQQAVLTKALARFRSARTGTYESEVRADGVSQPLAHETGSYRLEPVAAQLERAILGIDPTSSQPRVRVTRVRATADHHYFLQVKDWGSWTGCWLPMHLAALAKQTGVDLVRSGTLPTAIGVLAKARVAPGGGGMQGPHLSVDAYSALQFLGVSSSAISAQHDALVRVAVPVLLDVTSDGGPSGAAVEGSQAADALRSAGITLPDPTTRYVAKAHAQVVLGALGKPVAVDVPLKADRLPVKARLQSTCPANR
jgi:hypothetical protein